MDINSLNSYNGVHFDVETRAPKHNEIKRENSLTETMGNIPCSTESIKAFYAPNVSVARKCRIYGNDNSAKKINLAENGQEGFKAFNKAETLSNEVIKFANRASAKSVIQRDKVEHLYKAISKGGEFSPNLPEYSINVPFEHDEDITLNIQSKTTGKYDKIAHLDHDGNIKSLKILNNAEGATEEYFYDGNGKLNRYVIKQGGKEPFAKVVNLTDRTLDCKTYAIDKNGRQEISPYAAGKISFSDTMEPVYSEFRDKFSGNKIIKSSSDTEIYLSEQKDGHAENYVYGVL